MFQRLVVLAAIFSVSYALAQPMEWTFEKPVKGLELPADLASVVAENPTNHVLRVSTDRPHHTIVKIAGSEQTPDFVLSLRARLIASTGATPVVYLYGRQGKGFRGLQVDANGAYVLCWKGKGEHNPRFGPGSLRLDKELGWLRMEFACVGDFVAGKVWLDGKPEPKWQIVGSAPNQPDGWSGFGVWTHPKTPSSATVLFDDVSFTPTTPDQAEALGIQTKPRQQLTTELLRNRQGVFETEQGLVLAGERTALLIDSATGEIASVLDRPSGQEFVASVVRTPLFRGELFRTGDGGVDRLSAHDFARIEVQKRTDDTVGITFADHLQYQLRVTATIRLTKDGDFRFGIKAENGTDQAITRLDYPLAPSPAALDGDGGNDRMVLPWSAGGLLPNPGSRHARREAAYPGSSYAQFTALYNDRSGIYWAAQDPDGNPKVLCLNSTPGLSCGVHFAHRFPALPGKDIALPYDVVMTTFKGDWMNAADRYREWAASQPWCATKLVDRADIPDFLKEGSGIVISGVASQKARERLFGDQFERLPEVLNAYREATGLKHMVFIPYGWENRGTWAGINYFPAIPSNETWEKVNRTLREQGHRTAFLTSGYWWVVKRQRTGSGPGFDDTADFEQRKDMCVRNHDGSIWNVDWYERTKTFGSWRGYSVGLCHGSKQAQQTMKEIFLQAASLGVPLVSFDQEIGGSQHAPCYHPGHGHTPGWGRWMWTDFRDLCKEILRDGKPIQPELGLFLENVSELAIPYMATYWSRQFGEVDIGSAHGRGLGLFSYLYHDYVTMIGAACVQGQGQLGTRGDVLLRCRIMANNLTRGLIPGPFMHDVPLTGGDKWRQTVSKAYQSYCQPYARFPQYLLLGKACRPPTVECATFPTFYYRRDSKGKALRPNTPPVSKVETELEAVTVGSFQGADGSIGTVIVNATDKPQDATIHLAAKQNHALHQTDGTALAEKPQADGTLRLSLEPFGVRFIVSH